MDKERRHIIVDGQGTEREIQQFWNTPKVWLPEPSPDRRFDELLDSLSIVQAEQKKFDFFEKETTVKIETPSPFCYVRFLSDIHLDRKDFNTQEFRRGLEAVRQYPIFLIIVGDIGSFFGPKRFAEGMLEAVLTPDQQLEVSRKFFQEFKDKILAIVPGNHEDFVRRSSGIEAAHWLTQGLGIPLLQNESLLHLQVNEQTYDLYLFHKIARYYSSLNLTNALRRAREMGMNVDMVVQGHYEVGAMEKLTHRTDKPYLLQLGTFKAEDRFRVEQGYIPRGQPFYPIVRFLANRKNIEATEDLDQALMEIEAFEQWAKTKKDAIIQGY